MNLFGEREWWDSIWRGMPEFVQERLHPFHSIQVDIQTEAASEQFQKLAGDLYHDKWMWFPARKYGNWADMKWTAPHVLTRYPIYVISKGRWESAYTARSLERMGVDYQIVVEPQEAKQYQSALGERRVLVLPFSNLGQGSIPARNWVWEHAVATGAARHWIMDDNLLGFYRLNRNVKHQVVCSATLRATEDFADRYENVALAGFQYESFAMRREKWPPVALNTRIYSCILIQNSLPFRWRGRYNEDTDLSLRALKAGYCTALFYAFLANKMATMTMKGGNTDELYTRATSKEDDGRWKMAESLREQHPDVTSVIFKWGRWQHNVNYETFKRNALKPTSDLSFLPERNEYGMELCAIEGNSMEALA